MTVQPTRRRRLSSAERRASILAAARALFVEHGYEATTTRMIGADAGVSDAMIYRHFPTKRDLLLALVDEMTAQFTVMASAAVGAPVPENTPPGILLQLLGGRFAEVFDAHLDLVVLLLTNRGVLGGDRRFVGFIDQAASRLAGRLDPDDRDRGYLLARGFMGAIASLGLLQRTLGMDDVHAVDAGSYVDALAPLFATGARR